MWCYLDARSLLLFAQMPSRNELSHRALAASLHQLWAMALARFSLGMDDGIVLFVVQPRCWP